MPCFVRACVVSLACAAIGCGSDVEPNGDPSSVSTGAGASSAEGGAGSGAAGSAGGGAVQGGAGQGGAPQGGAGGGVPEWTVWPGQIYAAAPCEEETGLRDLLVELWPYADEACLPPVEVASVPVLGITDWDGSPGTYPFGVDTAHGKAGASDGLDPVEGWLTVEPYQTTPGWIEWEMSGEPGRTDLSLCGKWMSFACRAP